MSYSVQLSKEVIPLSKGIKKLNIWVTSTTGFEDPGVFLLHRRRSITNDKALPLFETFANPCTLVEYPYKTVDRNWGMYRDRELSILFKSQEELDTFWSKILERKNKLERFMTLMEDDIKGTGSLSIDDVTIKQSSSSRPFTRIEFEASESAPFMFVQANGMTMFVGIDGVDNIDNVIKEKKLSIITYTPRVDLFMSNILTDLASR